MKMTVAAAKRKHGSLYRIAQIVDRNRSTVGRWKRFVPAEHVAILEATEGRSKEGA